MRLTSHERHLLAAFIEMPKEMQEQTIAAAEMDPRISGVLLRAYREVLNLI